VTPTSCTLEEKKFGLSVDVEFHNVGVAKRVLNHWKTIKHFTGWRVFQKLLAEEEDYFKLFYQRKSELIASDIVFQTKKVGGKPIITVCNREWRNLKMPFNQFSWNFKRDIQFRKHIKELQPSRSW
jgi:hypothetical protein